MNIFASKLNRLFSHKMRRGAIAAAVLLCAAGVWGAVVNTTYYWIGGSTGNWNDANNWSTTKGGSHGSHYPKSDDGVNSDTVIFPCDIDVIVNVTDNVKITNLTTHKDSTGKLTFNIASGKSINVGNMYIIHDDGKYSITGTAETVITGGGTLSVKSGDIPNKANTGITGDLDIKITVESLSTFKASDNFYADIDTGSDISLSIDGNGNLKLPSGGFFTNGGDDIVTLSPTVTYSAGNITLSYVEDSTNATIGTITATNDSATPVDLTYTATASSANLTDFTLGGTTIQATGTLAIPADGVSHDFVLAVGSGITLTDGAGITVVVKNGATVLKTIAYTYTAPPPATTTYYWIGESITNPTAWNDADNWSNDDPTTATPPIAHATDFPKSGDTAIFNTAGAHSFSENIAVAKIEIASGAEIEFSGTVTVDEIENNGKIANAGSLTLGGYAGSGELKNSGTLTVNSTTAVAIEKITNSGTVENIGSGAVTIATLTMAADCEIKNSTTRPVGGTAYDGQIVIGTLSGTDKVKLNSEKGQAIVANAFSNEPKIETSGNNILLGEGTIASLEVGGIVGLLGDLTINSDLTLASGKHIISYSGSYHSITVNGDVNNSGLLGRKYDGEKWELSSLTVTGTTINSGTIVTIGEQTYTDAVTNSGTINVSGSGSTLTLGGNFTNSGTFTTNPTSKIVAAGIETVAIDFGTSIINIASFTYEPSEAKGPDNNLTITTPNSSSFGDFIATAFPNVGFASITINGDNKFNNFTTDYVGSVTMGGKNEFAGNVTIAKDTNVTLSDENTFNGNFTLTGDTEAKAKLTLGAANTFNGNFTFTNGAALTVGGVQTLTSASTLSLSGTSSQLLKVGGSGHFIGLSEGQTATYLKVNPAVYLNSTNSSPVICKAKYSEYSTGVTGSHNGWEIIGDTVTWTGANGNDWETAANWNPKIVPGIANANPENDTTGFKVIIPAGCSNYPTLAGVSYSVSDLEISGKVTFSGAGRIKNNAAVTINDAANGGTIEYTGSGQTIESFGYAKLIVAASSTITSGGDIVVNDTAEISGKVEGVNSFVVNGATTIKADIATTTTQTYNAAVTIDVNVTLAGTEINFNDAVTVGAAGATFNAAVTLASGKTMTVGASAPMVFGGDFTNSGIYSGNGSTITFESNFTNSGTFTDANAAITATGKAITSGAATIDFGTGITAASFTYAPDASSSKEIEIKGGANTFSDNFNATSASGAKITISGANSFAGFSIENADGATLTINAAQTVNGTTDGALVLSGTSTTPLTITGTGSFVLSADQTGGEYLLVKRDKVSITPNYKYFYATNSAFDSSTDSEKYGVHNNWVILNDAMVFTWKSGVSGSQTDWANAGNWDVGLVPGLDKDAISAGNPPVDTRNYNVVIPNVTSNKYPTAAAAYTIGNLTIGDTTMINPTNTSASMTTDVALTLSTAYNIILEKKDGTAGKFYNYGKVIYSNTGRIIDNDTTPNLLNDVDNNGTVEYSGSATTLTDFGTTDYFNLIVDAELTDNGSNEDIIVAGNMEIKADKKIAESASNKINLTVEGDFKLAGFLHPITSLIVKGATEIVSVGLVYNVKTQNYYGDVKNNGLISFDVDGDITFGANFTNTTSGSFAAGTSTVTINVTGTSATIDCSGKALTATNFVYNPLDSSGNSAPNTASLTIKSPASGENIFTNFTATNLGGAKITLDGAQKITGTLTLSGKSDGTNIEYLTIDGTGSFKLAATQKSGEYLNIKREASSITKSGTDEVYFIAENSKFIKVNSDDLEYGIHNNWIVLNDNMVFTWKGGVSGSETSWAAAGNWDMGIIPGTKLSAPNTPDASGLIDTTKYNVLIPVKYPVETGTNIEKFPTAAAEYTIGNLTIGDSSMINPADTSASMTTDVALTLSTADNIILADSATLTNFGKIKYSNTGRIIDNATPSKLLNDTENKGTVEYSDSATTLTDFNTGTNADYYNLIVGATVTGTATADIVIANKALVKGDISTAKSIAINGDAEISSTISSVGSLTVTKTTTLDKASVTTTGDQTYTGAVTVQNNATTLTAANIVFNDKVTTSADTTLTATSVTFKDDVTNSATLTAAPPSGTDEVAVTIEKNYTNDSTNGKFIGEKAAITATNADATIAGGAGIKAASFEYKPAGNSGNLTISGTNQFTEKFHVIGIEGKLTVSDKINLFDDSDNTNIKSAELKLTGKSTSTPLVIDGTGSFVLSETQATGEYLSVIRGKSFIKPKDDSKEIYYVAGNSEFHASPIYGHHQGWVILHDDMEFVWTGAVDTAWEKPGNWNYDLVPGKDFMQYDSNGNPVHEGGTPKVSFSTKVCKVAIPVEDLSGTPLENYPVVKEARTVRLIEIGKTLVSSSTNEITDSMTTKVSVTFENNGSLTLTESSGALTNKGKIIYSAAGRIGKNTSDTPPAFVPLNDVANKGTVVYNGDESATQILENFNASGADYYNLIIETDAKTSGNENDDIVIANNAVVKGEVSTAKSIAINGDAEISGNISSVGTLTVTKTTVFDNASVSTTGNQTYKDAVTINNASLKTSPLTTLNAETSGNILFEKTVVATNSPLSITAANITFKDNVASNSAITITNSGLLLTAAGKNIALTNNAAITQNGTGLNQIGGGITTDGTGTANFATDVYIYGNANSTFGGGTGAFTLAGNLHIAPSAGTVEKTFTSPFIAKNIILYSGKLNVNANLTTTASATDSGDLIIFGAGYNVDDKHDGDADSDQTGLFTYHHEGRDVLDSSGNRTHAAPSYKYSTTENFPATCPDGTTAIPNGTTGKEYSATLNVATGKTIIVGKNFYANGTEITGAGAWNLSIPNSDNQKDAFAELYNSSIANCTVTGGVIAAAEANTVTGCTGVYDSRPLIAQAYTVYDDVIFVEFKDSLTGDPIKIENSNNEIWRAVDRKVNNIHHLNGTTPVEFVGAYIDADCTTTTDGKGDIASFYIKTATKWNTNATGISAGNDGTDRSGTQRNAIPCINLKKALDGVYETLRDEHKNRIAQYYTPSPNFASASSVAGKTFTDVADHCAPVIIAVYTGQEMHENDAAQQKDYDSHNFIEFLYSEAVEIGDGAISIPQSAVNIQANANLGATASNAQGFTVAGFGTFSNGKLEVGLKPGSAGVSPNALYRNYSIASGGAAQDNPRRLRISVAGYVDGIVSATIHKNWTGYISQAVMPTATLERIATDFVKDISTNKNSADAGLGLTNHTLTPLAVNARAAESDLYGAWDVTPPSFAPMRVNDDENYYWKRPATDGSDRYEIIGISYTGGMLSALEVHMFDNEPTYDSNESPQWFSRIGWATPKPGSTMKYNTIQSKAADVIGGSRPYAASKTSGGIRYCTIYNANNSFSYADSNDNYSSYHSFSQKIEQSAESSLFTDVAGSGNPIDKNDGHYFRLFLDDNMLTSETDFILKFDSSNCYITDLAGNRIQCGNIAMKSVDRTPPSFIVSVAPLGKNQLMIMFTKTLNVNELRVYESQSVMSRVNALEYIPQSIELTNASGTGIQIDKTVPAKVVFQSRRATGIAVTLTKDVVLDDITKGVFITIKSSTNAYDPLSGTVGEITYIQDGFGNFVKNGRQHAFSDFAVNAVQMQYAYPIIDPTMEDIEKLELNQGNFVVRNWDEKQGRSGYINTEKEIILNARLYDGTEDNSGGLDTSQIVTAYFDSNPKSQSVSNVVNALMDGERIWRVWLPNVTSEIFDNIALANNDPQFSCDRELVATSNATDRQFANFDISKDTSTQLWSGGDQVRFMFKLGDYTVDHNADGVLYPLYCLRLSDEADLASLDLWSFTLKDMSFQRGGVTILNNVINVNEGQKTTIKVDLARPGNLNVIVTTLDGNVVKYLHHGKAEKGTHYFTWNGSNNNTSPVARGLYFVRVVGPGIDETRKVMCVK